MKKSLLLAGMISIVAVLCLAGWAVAQQAATTDIFGGPGGVPFLDPEPGPGARVVGVQIRSGDNVDAVQLVYMLGDGRTITGPQHGGNGGGLNVFQLDPDEYLVGISGRSGTYIDSIRFQTNKRTSPTFGGRGGDRDFSVNVPPNAQVTGLTGRAGGYLDAIGVTFSPLRRGPISVSRFGRTPQPGQTDLAGGPGGADFVDGNIPPGAAIVEVRVNMGNVVDSIQMIYNTPDGRSVAADAHGGGGGRTASFRLQRGEYIIGISGRCGTYVDSLRILTNKRMSPPFGGSGGDNEYRIDVPPGNQATGFIGRSGTYLDAVGLSYARIFDPRNQPRDRRGR